MNTAVSVTQSASCYYRLSVGNGATTGSGHILPDGGPDILQAMVIGKVIMDLPSQFVLNYEANPTTGTAAN